MMHMRNHDILEWSHKTDEGNLDSSFKSQVPCEVYTSPAGGLALCKPRNAVVDNFPPFSMATMMDIPMYDH